MEDISNGLESRPIPVEPSSSSTSSWPAPFRYVRRSIPGPGVDREQFADQLSGCDCRQDCDPHTCSCLRPFGANFLPRSAQLNSRAVSSPVLNPILECNSQCTCHASCSNRLVQHGPRVPLNVAPCGSRGFGLFTREDIQELTFVCEYAGEVVSPDEARKRLERKAGGMNYLIVLREHCESGVVLTCVDPEHVGNVGRFANHSCDPNLLMVPVRVDNSIPRLALFARRNISAGEELTFDYSGESVLNSRSSDMYCPVWESEDTLSTSGGKVTSAGHSESVANAVKDSCISLKDGSRNSKFDKGDDKYIKASTNTSEMTSCESSNVVNCREAGDPCQRDRSCRVNLAHAADRQNRKRTHSGDKVNCSNGKLVCNEETVTKHGARTEAEMNKLTLKVCLCGAIQCRGYLPFDSVIFESSGS